MLSNYELTSGQPILSITSPNFSKYGAVHDIDLSPAIAYVNDSVPLPESGNGYVANDDNLAQFPQFQEVFSNIFAELPIQTGWCVGNLSKMNGMEWHKSSEVVIACTDMVLLLGSFGDIIDDTFNTLQAEAFFLPKGAVVELYAFTLHLAPLNMGSGFKSIIVLPKGTNLPLASGIKGSLRAINKWLLVHEEHTVGIALGGKVGLVGINTALARKG